MYRRLFNIIIFFHFFLILGAKASSIKHFKQYIYDFKLYNFLLLIKLFLLLILFK